MKITDEMIEAGARAYDEVAMEGPRDYSGAYETAMQVSKDILEAALTVAPEPGDVRGERRCWSCTNARKYASRNGLNFTKELADSYYKRTEV